MLPSVTEPTPRELATMAAIYEEIRRRLGGLDGLERRLEAATRVPPSLGSLQAADHGYPDARFVSLHASQALFSAIDHLNTWRLLVDRPGVAFIPILAHLTLLRGAIEGALRCRWLVDPAIDSRTRVARGYAAKRDDYLERGRFETSSKKSEAALARTGGLSAAQRVAELDATRDAAGIPSVGFKDTTALAIHYGWERWFRLASAAAHGKEWALVGTDIDSSEPVSPGVLGGPVSASNEVALGLTLVAARLVEAALAQFEAYGSALRPTAGET